MSTSSNFLRRELSSMSSQSPLVSVSAYGENCIVMEAMGNYHLSVANFLYDSGFYVSVVNAMLVYGYGNNSLRRAKTDKKNAIKLSNYSLDRWLMLYCFGEFIYEQIADMEGYTKRAVKFSVDIALKNLKEIFQG